MARCTATVIDSRSKNYGGQCGRNAMIGGTLCAMHGGVEQTTAPLPERIDRFRRKCSANAKDGGPCKNFAIHGATVCQVHGGNLPHVRKAARERLLELVDPAMAELARIVSKPATTDADRLRAIQMVLDRTGYHAKTEISAEVKPWEGLVSGGILRDLPTVPDVEAEIVNEDAPRDLDGIVRHALETAVVVNEDLPTEQPNETATVVPLDSFRNPPAHLR